VSSGVTLCSSIERRKKFRLGFLFGNFNTVKFVTVTVYVSELMQCRIFWFLVHSVFIAAVLR
jgi:hypothetical protein